MRRRVSLLALIALALAVPSTAGATIINNFTGPYAVGNWTTIGTCGSVNTAGAPASIVLTSCDDGSGFQKDIDFVFTAFEPTLISFNFSFTTADDTFADPFGYLAAGVFFQRTSGTSQNQAGSVIFQIFPGQSFGFRARSVDGIFGPSTTTVSAFQAVTTPEPATLLLLGTGLALAARRRRA